MGRGRGGNAATNRPANSTGKSKFEGMGINVNAFKPDDLKFVTRLRGEALDSAIEIQNLRIDKSSGSLEEIVNAKPKASTFGFTEDRVKFLFNDSAKQLDTAQRFMASSAAADATRMRSFPEGSAEYKEAKAKWEDSKNTYNYVKSLKLWKRKFHLK